MSGVRRIILLVTSPRMPAGLLTAAAWDAVRAHPVLTEAESELSAAVRAAGGTVSVVPADAATVLAAAAEHGTVVWLAGPGGDEELARDLGLRLAREPGLGELELMYGSWDPPGARLLDAVAVMDRLVSPGGDPWKRAQTHATLAKYLLEECYEAYDAIEAGDLTALREELGDVLMQVAFHSVVASERTDDTAFTIDDVAAGIVDKLVRRHPHVFADVAVSGADEVNANWEQIKAAERAAKAQAEGGGSEPSVLDGVPMGQPALSLAAQLWRRASREGVPDDLAPAGDGIGARLFALVREAREQGVDPESELRAVSRVFRDRVQAWERQRNAG